MAIDVAHVFLAFIVLLFSLTVHEAAHAWTADRLGDPTARLLGRVSLNPIVHADLFGTVIFPIVALTTDLPIIGWAKPVPVNIRNLRRQWKDHVLVAAAGPASNLCLAIVAALVLRVIHVSPMTQGELNVTVPLARICGNLVQVNILLAIFNMLPIPPLDGGNVLSGLLPRPMARQMDALRPYGFLVIYALMMTGVLSTLVMPPYALLMSWLL